MSVELKRILDLKTINLLESQVHRLNRLIKLELEELSECIPENNEVANNRISDIKRILHEEIDKVRILRKEFYKEHSL